MWLHHRVMSPNNADGMANSVDPDQTAPLGVVWSGPALFAQAYLSGNLGSLWYVTLQWWWAIQPVVTRHCRVQSRGLFGRKSLPNLAQFSLFWAEGEVKKVQNIIIGKPKIWTKTSPWMLLNFSLSESSMLNSGHFHPDCMILINAPQCPLSGMYLWCIDICQTIRSSGLASCARPQQKIWQTL